MHHLTVHHQRIFLLGSVTRLSRWIYKLNVAPVGSINRSAHSDLNLAPRQQLLALAIVRGDEPRCGHNFALIINGATSTMFRQPSGGNLRYGPAVQYRYRFMRRRHHARGNNMCVNPFDNEGAAFSSLVNRRKQYRLWSTFADVAASWPGSLRSGSSRCIPESHYKSWTDIRAEGTTNKIAAASPNCESVRHADNIFRSER